MNTVLTLSYNCLANTTRALRSVWASGEPTHTLVVDNGSHDGTQQWLLDMAVPCLLNTFNRGVSSGWNAGLSVLFERDIEHVLVINNDVVLPPWFYRELLSYHVPFVTGVAVDDIGAIKEPATRTELQPTPDFSAFLIRRQCWERVGPFNKQMNLYASDCDFHIRAHLLGFSLWKANVPFYHERSSTLNLAPPEERTQIEVQANSDREVFRSIYSCLPGTPEYQKLFE